MIIRMFDIIISFVAIIVLFPLLIPIIIGLMLTGEHYVFYLQPRIGKRGEKFNVIKFATMLKNSPNLPGGLITQLNDKRILPMGRFLRKSKINELPQLINIFMGKMSFVGPRPVVEQHLTLYSENERKIIISMTPGLTGIASLIFRDEDVILDRLGGNREYYHNNIIAPYKARLEIWWSKNKNIVNYFKIIILTAWVLFFRKSNLWRKWFTELPKPPKEIEKYI